MRRALLIAVIALLAACYRPDLPDCSIHCGANGACPPSLTCVDDWCTRTPATGAPRACRAAYDLGHADAAIDCQVIYVSAGSGDDGNSGCDASAAKRSIGAALAVTGGARREIRVCAGLYVESALVALGDLRGGFDCATWQRTATYGAPSFDGTNETIVQNGDPSPALTVSAGVVSIDGVTMRQSAVGSSGPTVAVRLDGGSTVMTNSRIVGASDTTAHKSVGVAIADAADVDLSRCALDGGSGTDIDVGSAALVIDASSSGTVHVHDNVIDGGHGDGDLVGAVGIVAAGGTLSEGHGTAIERNVVSGGHGRGRGMWSSYGIQVTAASPVDIVDNRIDAGVITDSTFGATGIYSINSGPVRILRNRIYGGRLMRSLNLLTGTSGIQLKGSGPVEITNNMIHGGDGSTYAAFGIFGGARASGIVVRHDTIVAGTAAAATCALYLDPSASAWIVENNILAGFGGQSVALHLERCASSGVLASLRNNLTFGSAVLEYGGTPGAPCTAGASFASDDDAQADLVRVCTASSAGCHDFGGVQASGNLSRRVDCGGDHGCIPSAGCGDAGGCFSTLFDAWDVDTGGRVSLFDTGWRLATPAPCAVSRSTLDLTALVPIDLYGSARTPSPSMGAHELDGACQ